MYTSEFIALVITSPPAANFESLQVRQDAPENRLAN
jgi:hypothetical protein